MNDNPTASGKQPLGFVFVTECDVFGKAIDPRGHILVQVDERTYRLASGIDLAVLEESYPGVIGSLPRELSEDKD